MGGRASRTPTGLDQTITDENGHTTVQGWQAYGDPSSARLASLRDAADRVWTYSYDILDTLTGVDPPGDTGDRSWSYDSRHLLQSEAHPESGSTRFTYDSAGRLDTKTDARGQVFQYGYDSNDRVTAIATPGNTGYNLAFTYDDSDSRRTMMSANVSTTFDYDDANRPIARTDVIAGRSFTVGYAYDGRDNLTRVTYPSGRQIVQDFDAANRMTDVSEPGGVTYADNLTYYPSGVLAGYTAGNGLTHTITVDTRQRVKDIDAGPIHLTYSYEPVGNVSGIDDRSDRNRDSSFGYDALDRLTGVTGFGASTYTYDALGNRRSKNGVSYTYHESTQRLTNDGMTAYQHDSNGNTIGAGPASYGYSPFNMLVRATVNGTTTSYAYDADQQRRLRVGATGTDYFVHGPGFVPLAEYQESNGALSWQRDYIYAGGRLIASVAPGTIGGFSGTFTDDPLAGAPQGTLIKGVHITELRTAVDGVRAAVGLAAQWPGPPADLRGQAMAVTDVTDLRTALAAAYQARGLAAPSYSHPVLTGGHSTIFAADIQEIREGVKTLAATSIPKASYYHLDMLGSVRAVTNAAGTVVRRHDYLPFGEEYQPETGGDARRFTGKERDVETGLDYFGARYYASRTGRFTTVDSVVTLQENLKDPQRWNRYGYVRNNPLRYIDPDGRILFDWQQFKQYIQDVRHIGQDGYGIVVPLVSGVAGVGSALNDILMVVGVGEGITAVRAATAGPAVAARLGQAGEAAVRAVADIGDKAAIRVAGVFASRTG